MKERSPAVIPAIYLYARGKKSSLEAQIASDPYLQRGSRKLTMQRPRACVCVCVWVRGFAM